MATHRAHDHHCARTPAAIVSSVVLRAVAAACSAVRLSEAAATATVDAVGTAAED